jgi:lysophospholipase L1-like esterase
MPLRLPWNLRAQADRRRLADSEDYGILSSFSGEAMVFDRYFRMTAAGAAFAVTVLLSGAVHAQIFALGDSNVYGAGISASENYPTQLQAALAARGRAVTVTNAGWSGDTTDGVLRRLDYAVPNGTRLVVLWIGDNDHRRIGWDQIGKNVQEIRSRLAARGIPMYRVELRPTWNLRKDRSNVAEDGRHLNGKGYAAVVRQTLPGIERMLK